MKPKVSVHLEGDAAQIDLVELDVNAKLTQLGARDKNAMRKTSSPTQRKRLKAESSFGRVQDRDGFFDWIKNHQAARNLAFGHVTRHDCREDEPEPDRTINSLDISADASDNSFNRQSGSFVADGYASGMKIEVRGFVVPGNNATWVVNSVSGPKLTVRGGNVTTEPAGSEVIIRLAYEDIEYQRWRLDRDCRAQNFVEERWGTPEIAEAADPPAPVFNPWADEVSS